MKSNAKRILLKLRNPPPNSYTKIYIINIKFMVNNKKKQERMFMCIYLDYLIIVKNNYDFFFLFSSKSNLKLKMGFKDINFEFFPTLNNSNQMVSHKFFKYIKIIL